ncbi:threonylcarbamoyl-AMP synthase [mine drainage metagenome]|uniref:L-threonylcarbamoyladenylate synthase n=1 Tax=mine drainage metagenome TaxID=410659 RepID=A0A1J5Q1P2_9ZZZZ
MSNVIQVPLLVDQREEIVTRAAGILKRGGQVIFPTEHSYAIAVDAFNAKAVAELNELRGAPEGTALSVMIGSPRTLSGIAREIPLVGDLLISALWPGLLTLVVPTSLGLAWDLGDGGTLGTVAVRMPLHPLAIDILRATGPLAVTTASLVGTATPLEVGLLPEIILESAELVLDVGALPPGLPSSMIDLTVDPPRLLRAGSYSREALQAIAPDLVLD